jgi:hypothetical protein
MARGQVFSFASTTSSLILLIGAESFWVKGGKIQVGLSLFPTKRKYGKFCRRHQGGLIETRSQDSA